MTAMPFGVHYGRAYIEPKKTNEKLIADDIALETVTP